MSPAAKASLENTLPSLLTAYGPPGREAGVRAVLRRLLRGAGTLEEDATGNLHLHQKGSGPRLLLTAHMDAPGIIITRLEGETGQARVAVLGTRRPAELIGATVRFSGGQAGLVSWERKDGPEPEAEQLLLETGIAKRGKKSGLDVGDVAALEDRPARLGEYWCGANLDNRAGCAALVLALSRRRRSRYDIHAVFTAQSELGARGAITSAFGIEPDLAVVIDVAHVGEPKETSGFEVGKGPCVALKEQGFLAHPETLDLVRRAARASRARLQYLIREGEGSDARAIRAARTGVPTAVIAIPARRSGSVWSLVDARDLKETSDLIAAIVAGGPPARAVSRRRSKGGRR